MQWEGEGMWNQRCGGDDDGRRWRVEVLRLLSIVVLMLHSPSCESFIPQRDRPINCIQVVVAGISECAHTADFVPLKLLEQVQRYHVFDIVSGSHVQQRVHLVQHRMQLFMLQHICKFFLRPYQILTPQSLAYALLLSPATKSCSCGANHQRPRFCTNDRRARNSNERFNIIPMSLTKSTGLQHLLIDCKPMFPDRLTLSLLSGLTIWVLVC
ncbi:hypothetical protein F5887DRAFT_986045 [Amanita rubescens]|nr:hypothetical protein F5887DRAFT_986045 [Amanita rubescens]